MSQKYNKGDLVRIADDLGGGMSHFESGCDAIVMGSYQDQYGGGPSKEGHTQYTLLFRNGGKVSWYYELQLTLIEKDRNDLASQWIAEAEEEKKQKSDLDWIFSHGKEVAENPLGASIAALASCFGLVNLWGNHGEGYVYYINARYTLGVALPFLLTNDKDGWLTACKTITPPQLKDEKLY